MNSILLSRSKISVVYRKTFNRYTSFGARPQKKTWKYALKLSTAGVGGVLLSASVYLGYRWRRLKRKGFEVVWMENRGYRLLGMKISHFPLFWYKDTPLILPNIWRFEEYENLRVNKEDIFLVSYPRSGCCTNSSTRVAVLPAMTSDRFPGCTLFQYGGWNCESTDRKEYMNIYGKTWLQEIIYLITSNLDFKTAKSKIMDERFPFLDMHLPGLKAIDAMSSPRLLKTHMPYRLLPLEVHEKKPKIIYICRNPKDVIVSYYYQLQFTSMHFTIQDVVDSFMENEFLYGPWWRHVIEFWERRDDDNILFLTYEDMKQNPDVCMKKIAEFLGKTLTDEDVLKIKTHCTVENMKKNKATNFDWFDNNFIVKLDRTKPGWIRKGEIGDWQNHLTPEMSRRVDEMVEEKFRETGLSFQDKPDGKSIHR